MDKQEYLNQISAKPAAARKPGGDLLHNKFLWVGLGGLAILVVIIILGAVLSGGKTTGKDQLFALILHLDKTSEMISTYQPDVKSSDLRSYSASLSSILSDTNLKLTDYAKTKFNYKPKSVDKKTTAAEEAAQEELNNELFEAKINGILDRIYAHKMAYEISVITTREQQLKNATKNEDLINIIDTSYESLSNLYDRFNDFTGVN